ncbi:hypothetical protein P8452_47829 [Trifolium repens]|nr:hypothetical protein P8452_47829 [Trifolium repens]
MVQMRFCCFVLSYSGAVKANRKEALSLLVMQLAMLVQPLALPHPSEEPIQLLHLQHERWKLVRRIADKIVVAGEQYIPTTAAISIGFHLYMVGFKNDSSSTGSVALLKTPSTISIISPPTSNNTNMPKPKRPFFSLTDVKLICMHCCLKVNNWDLLKKAP